MKVRPHSHCTGTSPHAVIYLSIYVQPRRRPSPFRNHSPSAKALQCSSLRRRQVSSRSLEARSVGGGKPPQLLAQRIRQVDVGDGVVAEISLFQTVISPFLRHRQRDQVLQRGFCDLQVQVQI